MRPGWQPYFLNCFYTLQYGTSFIRGLVMRKILRSSLRLYIQLTPLTMNKRLQNQHLVITNFICVFIKPFITGNVKFIIPQLPCDSFVNNDIQNWMYDRFKAVPGFSLLPYAQKHAPAFKINSTGGIQTTKVAVPLCGSWRST